MSIRMKLLGRVIKAGNMDPDTVDQAAYEAFCEEFRGVEKHFLETLKRAVDAVLKECEADNEV